MSAHKVIINDAREHKIYDHIRVVFFKIAYDIEAFDRNE